MSWCPSREVSILAELAARDRRTVTAGNLAHVSALTGLDCATAGWLDLKAALPVKVVPDSEMWRLGLLDILICRRAELKKEEKDTKTVVAMLSSLCST